MNDRDTVERLVTDNIKLPFYMVDRYFKKFIGYCEHEDMVSVGNVGLVKAAQRFDSTRGIRFTTYACAVIHGEILKFLRDSVDAISFSRPTRELYLSIKKQGLGSLTIAEIAKVLHVPENKIKAAIDYSRFRYATSLNEIVCDSGEGDPVTIGECIRIYEDFDTMVIYSDINGILNQEERIVFNGRYIDEVNRSVIIGRLGKSWRKYEKIKKNVDKKLRRYLAA